VIAEEHRAVPPALAIHTRRGGGGGMEEKGESADLIVEIRNDEREVLETDSYNDVIVASEWT
jgi:hypothetical protein